MIISTTLSTALPDHNQHSQRKIESWNCSSHDQRDDQHKGRSDQPLPLHVLICTLVVDIAICILVFFFILCSEATFLPCLQSQQAHHQCAEANCPVRPWASISKTWISGQNPVLASYGHTSALFIYDAPCPFHQLLAHPGSLHKQNAAADKLASAILSRIIGGAGEIQAADRSKPQELQMASRVL